jgi:RNA polymerase sigma-70 factor (ECF subfamily)
MATTTSAQHIIRNFSVDLAQIPQQYWELIDKYRAELLNQARSITGSNEDAEDVVQETFCEVFRKPVELTKTESIGARLRLINKHNALNRIRDKRRAMNKAAEKQQTDPERAFTTGGFNVLELKESISKALEGLPEKQRLIVTMRYFQQLSLKEISGCLNIPIGTVGWMLSEASVYLFKKLQAQFGSDPSSAAKTHEDPRYVG